MFNSIDYNKLFGDWNQPFKTVFREEDDIKWFSKDGNSVYWMEVPGFNKDNLSVELEGRKLTITGKASLGNYNRVISKEFIINTADEIEAKIEDGILYITVKSPKDVDKKIKLL